MSAQRAPKRLPGELEGFDEKPKLGASVGPRSVKALKSEVAPASLGIGEEVDPLDAFMDGIKTELAQPAAKTATTESAKAAPWEDLEHDDAVASYYELYETKPTKRKKHCDNSDAEEEEDEMGEGEECADRRTKPIEPIPAVDHSTIHYKDVRTDFYTQHTDVAQMTSEDVCRIRAELQISAAGIGVLNPATSFGHLAESLGKQLMEGIRQHGYTQPTPIQAQAIPVALSGSDVIGIAKTGSGKTMAFVLPMLVHTMAQEVLQKDEGPIAVVLCPTRELAVQTEQEVFKFQKLCGIRSVTLAGGLSKHEQFKEIKRGCEIAICNPGRLIDIIKMKGCNMQRVTMLVLDEADRMFDMGFEYQVRSIVQNVRPTRQTMLFSATFPPKFERLAREILRNPVRITVGEVGAATQNVLQTVLILRSDDEKWPWLQARIDDILAKGQALIFVKSRASATDLQQKCLELLGKSAEVLHGDLDQAERLRVISVVRKQRTELLIATDVAARGLDILSIRTVVCFDAARDIQTHTHRIGRTGRAGAIGEAVTLLTDEDQNRRIAALLVENMEQAKQTVPEDLRAMAMKFKPFAAASLLGKTIVDLNGQDGDRAKSRGSQSRSEAKRKQSAPVSVE